ncbi:hypothetical protein LR48_Vigan04g086700 [Vigna angularis]|uniref:Uncharacterized protein n=1 Tax=Phaseolus angularis TaxID=3914 RepID=A0A0L9UDR4_PHAAN|nr:hypothetical protein LR48_Vigan04g086700 [Vigna angularis]
MKFKNKLWVIKDIKAKGVLEIEAPYSRRAKLVTRKLLKLCWDQAQASGGGGTSGAEAMAKGDLEEDSDASEGSGDNISYFVIFMLI